MSNKNLTVGLIAVAIIAIAGLFMPVAKTDFGAIGSATNFYSLRTDAGITTGTGITVGGASTFGGTVTVTTTNAATSTLVVGCVQTYATSTATPLHFAPSTATVSTTTFAGAGSGVNVALAYGACPL